jgi:hypothetical protein
MSRQLNYYKVWFSVKLPDREGRTHAWLIFAAESKKEVKKMAPEFLKSTNSGLIILRITSVPIPSLVL